MERLHKTISPFEEGAEGGKRQVVGFSKNFRRSSSIDDRRMGDLPEIIGVREGAARMSLDDANLAVRPAQCGRRPSAHRNTRVALHRPPLRSAAFAV
jgi:hypothetical protein